VGLVPEVPAGRHPLRIQLADRRGQVTVDVRPAAVIQDPVGTVNTALDNYLSAVPAAAPAGSSPEEWTRRRTVLDSLTRDTKAKMAAASPAEQLAAARWVTSLQAGSAASQSWSPALSLSPSAANFVWSEGCQSAAKNMVRYGIGYVAGATTLGLSLQPIPGILPQLRLIGGGIGATAVLASGLLFSGEWARAIQECYAQESIEAGTDEVTNQQSATQALLSTQAGSATLTFEPDKPVRIFVRGKFRAFNSTDAGSPTFAGTAAAIDELHAAVGKLPQWVRDMLPALPPRLKDKAPTPAVVRSVAPALVKVENVTPSSIRLTTRASGAALLVSASSTEEVETTFKFDVVSTENPSLRSSVSALLKAPSRAVAFADGKLLPDPVHFQDGVAQSFKVVAGDGSAISNFDYSQLGMAANANSHVAISGKMTLKTTGFDITLTSSDPKVQKTSFDVTYKGQKLQTVNAAISDVCARFAPTFPGTWIERTTQTNPNYGAKEELQYLAFGTNGTWKLTRYIQIDWKGVATEPELPYSGTWSCSNGAIVKRFDQSYMKTEVRYTINEANPNLLIPRAYWKGTNTPLTPLPGSTNEMRRQ
jgi:hypothetical protein